MAWEFAEFIINDDGIAQFIAAGWQLIGIRQTTRRARRYRVAVMRRPRAQGAAPAEVKELVVEEDVVAAC
ncbi:MAG TPA: hypothetical protein VFS62_14235 [Chloroflexota bacterium]|jgi:hypothetical protein|nr:hypothetical protein [Chloroflexota bacterium]